MKINTWILFLVAHFQGCSKTNMFCIYRRLFCRNLSCIRILYRIRYPFKFTVLINQITGINEFVSDHPLHLGLIVTGNITPDMIITISLYDILLYLGHSQSPLHLKVGKSPVVVVLLLYYV